ncbi:spore germination protein [Metabacillus sp. KIGAM252]|uniref:Spore germination protein n=1 Tax=Metabacillus flavus TaxID=2823519 RepID=A0ABS5LEC4_9BACI|nr:spore germination protein [Metabacillus flavus]MBS2969106.1 spore germination protein [Metabacillus flavus]
MGVYIKSLVINEVSGGVVHFGNAVNVGTISASKSVEGSGSGSMEETSQPPSAPLTLNIAPSAPAAMNTGSNAQRQSRSN